jgi:hypothetical protein
VGTRCLKTASGTTIYEETRRLPFLDYPQIFMDGLRKRP